MKYIEINLSNLLSNIRYIKSSLKKGVLFCAVVKSNAYGHGFSICKLIENQVDYFAVATCSEALKLRDLGVKNKILVLGITSKEEKSLLIKNNIDITISSMSELYQVLGSRARIHLKFNTGMNRIGFQKTADINKILYFLKNKKINVVGVYSHFYNANSYIDCMFQNNKFLEICSKFPEGLIKHISSTDAIFCSKEFNNSMVRCGIGMYGYCSNKKHQKELKPVMKVYGKVVQKTLLSKGEGVSYSHKYKVKKSHYISVINCGYYDGFMRKLENKKIRSLGKTITICGSVCMDSMMIKCNNSVINGNVCLLDNANDLAKLCDTSIYEILTNIKHERFNYIIK